MPIELNATHDPGRRSWVESANAPDTDFPIQNLPFGVFRAGGAARGGVALGDCIIDLARLLRSGAAERARLRRGARQRSGETLAPLLACAPAAVSALRAQLSDLFREGGDRRSRRSSAAVLVPMAEAELLMPLKPAAFTDFCTSYDHIRADGRGHAQARRAVAAGRLQRPRQLGRGRAARRSSVRCGQFEAPPGSNDVTFGPEPMLDFELEFGAWLRGGNALGEPIGVAEAEALLFGCCLVNDWSARGIQFFESILGPHLGKSFLTTISPWIVTMEALAPFRVAARGRAADEPDVPGYLLDPADREPGGIDIELTADLATPRARPSRSCAATSPSCSGRWRRWSRTRPRTARRSRRAT